MLVWQSLSSNPTFILDWCRENTLDGDAHRSQPPPPSSCHAHKLWSMQVQHWRRGRPSGQSPRKGTAAPQAQQCPGQGTSRNMVVRHVFNGRPMAQRPHFARVRATHLDHTAACCLNTCDLVPGTWRQGRGYISTSSTSRSSWPKGRGVSKAQRRPRFGTPPCPTVPQRATAHPHAP